MIPHSYVRLLGWVYLMVIFCHTLNVFFSHGILTSWPAIFCGASKSWKRWEPHWGMAMDGRGVRKVVIYYYLEDLDVDCWLMLTDVDWCWLAAPWVWTASESLTSRSSSHCLFGIFRHIWLRWLAFGAKTARFNRFDQVKPFKTGGVISSPWAFSPGWYLPDSRAQAGQQWYATRSPFPVLAWLGMGKSSIYV